MSINDSTTLLEVNELTMQFGGITAVKKLSFNVPKGEVVSVIGPNGAGKTSAFNAITGIYEPTAGTIHFQNRQQQKSVTPSVIVACIIAALLSAIAGMILLGDITSLWLGSVKTLNGREDFSYERSWNAIKDYHLGQGLTVTESTSAEYPHSINYPSNQGPIELAVFGDATKFSEHKQRINEKKANLKQLDRLQKHELAAEIVRDTATYNDSLRPQANELIAKLENIIANPTQETIDASKVDFPHSITITSDLFTDFAAQTRARHWKQSLGFLAGLLIGAFGYWTVWNRSRRTPDVIGLSGMARTFQNIRLFRNMTVIENVLIGLDRIIKGNALSMAFRIPTQVHRERIAKDKAMETLRFVGLEHRANRTAGSLPYGEQRRLEIARALATEPKLLLLDEPGAGMNPSETAELMELIRKIRSTGVTVLLIEHHMNVVMGISDRIVVMDQGQKIAEGTPNEVRNNPKVIEAYLGKEELG